MDINEDLVTSVVRTRNRHHPGWACNALLRLWIRPFYHQEITVQVISISRGNSKRVEGNSKLVSIRSHRSIYLMLDGYNGSAASLSRLPFTAQGLLLVLSYAVEYDSDHNEEENNRHNQKD